MSNITITINDIEIEVPEKTTLSDIMDKFFRARCEFVININSEFVPNKVQNNILLNQNDKLRIIAYSRHNYQPQKRTAYKEDAEKFRDEKDKENKI